MTDWVARATGPSWLVATTRIAPRVSIKLFTRQVYARAINSQLHHYDNTLVYACTPTVVQVRTYLSSQLRGSTQSELNQYPEVLQGLHRPRVPCRLGCNKNPIDHVGDSNEYSGHARGDGCSNKTKPNRLGSPNYDRSQASVKQYGAYIPRR